MLVEPDRSMASIATLLGVSRSTLYKALPELQPTIPGADRASAGRRSER
ncbi:hypothetical protein [Salinispora cortesiana]|nr:hypothetical protein [Salinispora cortesiana]